MGEKTREQKLEEEVEELKKKMAAMQQSQQRSGGDSGSGWGFGDILSFLFWGVVIAITGGAIIAAANSDMGKKFLTDLLGEDTTKSILDGMNSVSTTVMDFLGIKYDIYEEMAKKEITEIREVLRAEKTSAEVINIIAKDKETFMGVLDLAKKANGGGKVGKQDLMNANTVFTMLTEKHEMAEQLIEASLKGNNAGSESTKKVLESLRKIASESRLSELFNATQRPRTAALFKKLAPTNIDDKTIEAIFKEGVTKDGVVTDDFRAFLTKALKQDDKGKLQLETALKEYGAKNTVIRNLLIDVELQRGASKSGTKADDREAEKDPKEDAENSDKAARMLKQIASDDRNRVAFQELKQTLGENKFNQFMDHLGDKNGLRLMKFGLENRDVFVAFEKAANVSKLPTDVQGPLRELVKDRAPAEIPVLIAILDKGVDPRSLETVLKKPRNDPRSNTIFLAETLLDNTHNARKVIADAGVENMLKLVEIRTGKLPQGVTAKTLTAIITAMATIDENMPKFSKVDLESNDTNVKGKAHAARNTRGNTKAVTMALVELLVNKNPAAITGMQPEKFADFWNNEGNVEAFMQLLKDVKGELEPQLAGKVDAILTNRDAFVALARDPKVGAPKVLESLGNMGKRSYSDDSCKASPSSLTDGELNGFGGLVWQSWNISGLSTKPNVIGENLQDVKKLVDSLKAAECTSYIPPKPAPAASATR